MVHAHVQCDNARAWASALSHVHVQNHVIIDLSQFQACRLYDKEIDTLSGEVALTNYLCSLSEKGSTLKGKNLLPTGANSFLLE